MPIFRSDRDRRILGDRVVARKDNFCAIDPAVAGVHGAFLTVHGRLFDLSDTRAKEERDVDGARAGRNSQAGKVLRMYSWAYNQVPGMLSPSWESPPEPEALDAVQARLFPHGPPTAIAESPQLIHDAATVFVRDVAREPAVTFAPKFVAEFTQANAALKDSMATVVREGDEANQATDAHQAERLNWDNHHLALKEISSGFLRLKNQHGQLRQLFQKLPGGPSASEDAPDPAVEAPAEPIG